jgi:hypothetical protein
VLFLNKFKVICQNILLFNSLLSFIITVSILRSPVFSWVDFVALLGPILTPFETTSGLGAQRFKVDILIGHIQGGQIMTTWTV